MTPPISTFPPASGTFLPLVLPNAHYGTYNPNRSMDRAGRDNKSGDGDKLSTTNLYIRGLKQNTTDEDLQVMCKEYGSIKSTKAIIDKANNTCKGYGFVDFDSPESAEKAVQGLKQKGYQAQMAKAQVSQEYNVQTTEQDPTNLYIANLPPSWSEANLDRLCKEFGTVISTRILRNETGESRGVGFARMESKEKCEKIIERFNGKTMAGSSQPLLLKFADSGKKPKRPQEQPFPFMATGLENYAQLGYDQTRGTAMANGGLQSPVNYLRQPATAGTAYTPGAFYLPSPAAPYMFPATTTGQTGQTLSPSAYQQQQTQAAAVAQMMSGMQNLAMNNPQQIQQYLANMYNASAMYPTAFWQVPATAGAEHGMDTSSSNGSYGQDMENGGQTNIAAYHHHPYGLQGIGGQMTAGK